MVITKQKKAFIELKDITDSKERLKSIEATIKHNVKNMME